MEEKTQIEEKRVKSTIIRRRKSILPHEEEPQIQAGSEGKTQETGTISEAQKAQPSSQSTSQSTPQSISKSTILTAAADKTVSGSGAAVPATPQKEPPRFIILDKPKPKVEVSKLGTSAGLPLLAEEEDESEKGKDKKIKPKTVIKKKDGKLAVEVEGFGRVSTLTQLTRIAHADRVERVFEPGRMGPGGSKRRRAMGKKMGKKPIATTIKAAKRVIEMTQAITVGELAKGLQVKASEIIKKLMGLGQMATVNQPLDFDTATLIAQEYQYEVKNVSFSETKILDKLEEGFDVEAEPRPPVVTVMGHVDHGKTSLLDAIRQANVAGGEAGGITQHIGAYTVTLPKGKITFLDTPGHEAFTSMRARGASVTDIVILVVAADDGVMPQTMESIDHAKAADVPIVVAINKIDKPDANLDRIKRQLSDQGLMPEEWGGTTLYALVSAKQKLGIEELLETILLQAEVLELKANPRMKAKGVVVEARLDRARGPVATVLVQQGTLHAGDILVAGEHFGRVRAMTDHTGKQTFAAPPSYAVEVMGLDGVPLASETFNVVADEASARDISENRRMEKKKLEMGSNARVSLEDFFAKGSQTGTSLELPIILKTDVQGSLEAVSQALLKLNGETEKVKIKIIHEGVGGVSESDILLASASRAIIIGFNVRPETKALSLAKTEGTDVRLYKIIYEMINDVKLAMKGLLAPTKKEKYLGRAEVRQAFTVSKIGIIAGSYVVDGKLTRSSSLRLLRDNVVLHEGKITSLKRFKDDAKEVAQGFECGVGIEGYQDIKPGDVIEAFEIELIAQEL